MCGIAGILCLNQTANPSLRHSLQAMNRLQKHRGPDGDGVWIHPSDHVGLGHVRLSVIDPAGGQQPMTDPQRNWIVFNGAIYNYKELRNELGQSDFQTNSDTEVILHAYRKWGVSCLDRLRGMFAFALWDETNQRLFCARDRFGIKPFYYLKRDDRLHFASETKALLPFVKQIQTSLDGLKDYLTFQLCLDGKTLFQDIFELLPGHFLVVENGSIQIKRYWDIEFQIDFDHTEKFFHQRLRELLEESITLHLRSDVPIGSYLSGGLDSGFITAMAAQRQHNSFPVFHGRFAEGELFDESRYARELAQMYPLDFNDLTISSDDFIDHIQDTMYHLDYPVAGPGSFAQFMISRLAAGKVKVVLGGQGGDEIFGGYTRYLIAYFEQCIRGAIDGTLHNGEFIVTYDSIIPNLTALKNYKPLLKHFWAEGLFDEPDLRYFRLINRATDIHNEINWNMLEGYSAVDTFRRIFNSPNVGSNSYFDKITHFDFKTLLPGLLQVEDRMSMAHGLESRVPILDHHVIQFAATMPSNIKFKDGTLKKVLLNTVKDLLPPAIVQRKDKMGFPVPFSDWAKKSLQNYILDVFQTQKSRNRDIFQTDSIIHSIQHEKRFGRKLWGLLSLELWHQQFHDQAQRFQLDRIIQPEL